MHWRCHRQVGTSGSVETGLWHRGRDFTVSARDAQIECSTVEVHSKRIPKDHSNCNKVHFLQEII